MNYQTPSVALVLMSAPLLELWSTSFGSMLPLVYDQHLYNRKSLDMDVLLTLPRRPHEP
jgi:hypothetical protein